MELEGTSIQHEDPSSRITRNSRPKPLYTCGVAMLNIAHRASAKAESVQGPIGYITQRVTKLSSPIVSTMQYQWLAMLSYTDDQILAIENLIETIFPSSAYVFDKIDALVQVAKTLLVKFENAIDQFPYVIQLVDPIINHLFFTMMDTKEFELGKVNEDSNDLDCSDLAVIEDEKDPIHVSIASSEKVQTPGELVHVENENEPIKPNSVVKASPLDDVAKLEGAKEKEAVKQDPILELFAEGWFMR
ncbi:hypothetical protein IFM89_016913 [Coptis chinensis]|uniref:Uncharacterized protein n=1 Tax=Coptis chinensis TaxID=261450 RepID=A0A835HQZ3_9MAGN|nr:hypothetical protein IFM89_016913 [Coptis chinensis]